MASFPKWTQEMGDDATVADAAMHCLRVRLAAVKQYLLLAADCAEQNDEYVHQLRVYTRRSMAALRLYGPVIPKQDRRWFRKQLRAIRRAAGQARDLDVLLLRHASDSASGKLVKKLRARRQAAQQPIVAMARKLQRRDRFQHHVDEMLHRISLQTTHDSMQPFVPWATTQLRHASHRFFHATPSDPCDLDGLHRLRIRGKRLRYTIELLTLAFPRSLRSQVYPEIVKLQDLLGEINDCATARSHYAKWKTKAKSKQKAKKLGKLSRAEKQRLAARLKDFSKLWTREYRADLEQRLADYDHIRMSEDASRSNDSSTSTAGSMSSRYLHA